MEHTIKTHTPYYQQIVDGLKPFEFRLNDRGYKIGDELHHLEYDPEKQSETGRQIWCTVVNILHGGSFGIPEGYCIMTQHTTKQVDYIRDYDLLVNNILPRYEEKLSYKKSGSITERISHVLSELNSVSTGAIYKAKDFIDDVKTQFKALEIVVEGISSDSYNHTQKRVIANHVINLLRGMIQRINEIDFDYSHGMYDRYDFFRSNQPEKELYRKFKEMKEELKRLSGNQEKEIPF